MEWAMHWYGGVEGGLRCASPGETGESVVEKDEWEKCKQEENSREHEVCMNGEELVLLWGREKGGNVKWTDEGEKATPGENPPDDCRTLDERREKQ
jgi:hypothetical protein